MKTLSGPNGPQFFLEFCKAYTHRDLNRILSLCTTDIHAWGTGADENFIGLKGFENQLTRDWSQSEEGKLEVVSWFSPLSEDALWAAATCRATVVIEGASHIFDNLRGTITLDEENGLWKISHMHASFPDVRQFVGSSFPNV